MKLFVILFLAFLVFTVEAGTGAIPSGPNVKLLKDNLRFKNTDTKIMTNDSDDPSSVAKDAAIGSLYIKSDDGVLYQKQDAGSSTNWLPMILGPSGSGTDECVSRWDGTGVPLLQDSVFCVSDAGVATGATQLDVDNIRLDGNTVSSIDVNGNIILDPNGTGNVNLPDLTVSQPAYIDGSGNLVSQDISLTADVSGVLPIANGGTNSSTALNNNRVILSSGGSIVEGGALTDGQLFIGATGGAPVPANISGTTNQVSVSNGTNTITLSTPQDIATTSDVTFNSVDATTSVVGDTVQGTTSVDGGNLQMVGNTLQSTDTNGNVVLNPNGTGNVQLPDLTVSQPAYIDGSGNLVSQDISLTADVSGVLPPANGGTGVDGSSASNGQLLIGNGTGYSLATITGTADQVNVTNGSGSITLSTPQSIATTSSPTFVDLTLSNLTQNSVVFVGSSGILDEDNTNFTWNDGTDTLGVTGILNADNLRLDGNTLSSTDTNGNIILNPDGTGNVQLPDLTVSSNLTLDASGNITASEPVSPEYALYHQQNFEYSADASSFTCGTNLTAANDTSTPLNSRQSRSVTFTQGATPPTVGVQCTGPSITIGTAEQSRKNEICFLYTNDHNDDEIAVNVYDVTNSNELLQIPLKNVSSPTSICGYFTPASNTVAIRYEVEVLVQNASNVLEIDDIEFRNQLRPVDVYASSEPVSYTPTITGFSSVSSVNFEYYRKGKELTVVGEFTTGTLDGTQVTISFPESLTIQNTQSGSVPCGRIEKSVTTGLSYLPLCTNGDSFIQVGVYDNSSATNKLAAINSTGFFASSEVVRLTFTTSVQEWTDKENFVAIKGSSVNDIANTNEFSARVDNNGSSCTIITENVDFISNASCVRNSTGDCACSFNSGVFSTIPSGQVVAVDANTKHATFQSLTTSSFRVFSVNESGAATDTDFLVSFSKQGSDYVTESDKQIIFPDGIGAKFQTKYLSADVSNASVDNSSIQFNNLVTNRWYRLSGKVTTTSIGGTAGITWFSGASGTGTEYGKSAIYSDGGSQDISHTGVSFIFQAQSSTLYSYISASSSCTVFGNGTSQETYLTLEELYSHKETTDFN